MNKISSYLKYADFDNPSASVVGLELSSILYSSICFKLAVAISSGIKLLGYSFIKMFNITEDRPERERAGENGGETRNVYFTKVYYRK